MRTSKTAPKKKSSKSKKNNLIDYGYIFSLIKISRKKSIYNQWDGIGSVPPGSLLEDILKGFSEIRNNGVPATSIPLELPFLMFFHIAAAYLVYNNVKLIVDGQESYCDFSTVLLSKSGSGKTWTKNLFKKAFIDRLDDFVFELNPAGSAAFCQELEKHPKGLWVRDEVLQFFQQVENPNSKLAEVYDYLLRIYDNENIERITKKDKIIIKEPALCFLGMNVPETFIDGMTPTKLTDGFAQRYGYMLAKDINIKDIRYWKRVPDWHVDTTGWAEKWERMIKDIQPAYTISKEGIETYRKIFEELSRNTDVNESFFRRIVWKLHKYALVYHIINFNANNPEIQSVSYLWAIRLIERQLADAYAIINLSGDGRLGKLIKRCEEVIQAMIINNEIPTARNLMQKVGSKYFNNIKEAEYLLKMLNNFDYNKAAEYSINTGQNRV